MLLTNGNIKKSKLLRFMFLENVTAEKHKEACKEYHKTIEDKDFSEYLTIEQHLHDSYITIKEIEKNVIITCDGWSDSENKGKKFNLIFKNGKIVSWNKFRKSGHISKLNKKVEPSTFGYDEFYVHDDARFVSIIIFNKNYQKINTGIYYPMITIKYDELSVREIA